MDYGYNLVVASISSFADYALYAALLRKSACAAPTFPSPFHVDGAQAGYGVVYNATNSAAPRWTKTQFPLNECARTPDLSVFTLQFKIKVKACTVTHA